MKNKFEKVYLIDSFSPKSHHEQYNASMAIILSSIFNEVIYYVGSGQKESILTKMQDSKISHSKIKWKHLNVNNELKGKKEWIQRLLKSLYYNIYLLLKISPKSLIIYNYNNPLALWAIKLINLFKHCKIILITHGELEYLSNDLSIPYARTTRLAGSFFKLSFKFMRNTKNIYYLVLGESIKQNFISYNLANPSQIISLDHPYIFNQSLHLHNNHEHPTIGIKNINSSGLSDKYIQALADKYPNLKFAIISSFTNLQGNNIQNYTQKGQKSRKEYEKVLSTFDALLFLYRRTEYKLKASGAIFDAIELGIPIIALKNDYFEYLFKMHGELGYLYDDMQTLSNNISNAINDKEKLETIKSNLLKARIHHSPQSIATSMKQLLINIL